MSKIAFADVVHQTIYFSQEEPAEAIVLRLIDTAWFQRLRDIAQTGNTQLLYMFSEHSRLGHSIGVAYLANHLMNHLIQGSSGSIKDQVKRYRPAVSASALLHDIGHIAPGSHAAYKTWFPKISDCHEEMSVRIVQNDPELDTILGAELKSLVAAILTEQDSIPAWCWEVISGGGWNVDRGNWCIVDSVMAGVSYGRYNIPALLESIVITPDGHLALRENRLDSMLHFAIARHSMYRQVYQHRVLLASETINGAIVQRARDLGDKLDFADDTMKAVLAANSPLELSLSQLFLMRESWWRYHLNRWSFSSDPILKDLAVRLVNRRLLKTIRVTANDNMDELISAARVVLKQLGFDPRYYLHQVSTSNMHGGDSKQSMPVLMDDGTVRPLSECDPLWNTLMKDSAQSAKRWLVLPEQAKKILGRER